MAHLRRRVIDAVGTAAEAVEAVLVEMSVTIAEVEDPAAVKVELTEGSTGASVAVGAPSVTVIVTSGGHPSSSSEFSSSESGASVGATGAVELVEADAIELESEADPVRPPVAPAASIRATASAWVSHAMEVPALLTSGRAAQMVPPAHCVTANFPPTH